MPISPTTRNLWQELGRLATGGRVTTRRPTGYQEVPRPATRVPAMDGMGVTGGGVNIADLVTAHTVRREPEREDYPPPYDNRPRLRYNEVHFVIYHRDRNEPFSVMYADGQTNGWNCTFNFADTLHTFVNSEEDIRNPSWDIIAPHWNHIKVTNNRIDEILSRGNYRLENTYGDEILRVGAAKKKKNGSSPSHHHVCTKCKAVRRCTSSTPIITANKLISCNDLVKLMCADCAERKTFKDIPIEDKPCLTKSTQMFVHVNGTWTNPFGDNVDVLVHGNNQAFVNQHGEVGGYITYDVATDTEIRNNQGQAEAHQGRGEDVPTERPRGDGDTRANGLDVHQWLEENPLA
jgi:hypothetical protein